MRLKAESTIFVLIFVLVEFLRKFTSNNDFQLSLEVLLNFAPEKDRSD